MLTKTTLVLSTTIALSSCMRPEDMQQKEPMMGSMMESMPQPMPESMPDISSSSGAREIDLNTYRTEPATFPPPCSITKTGSFIEVHVPLCQGEQGAGSRSFSKGARKSLCTVTLDIPTNIKGKMLRIDQENNLIYDYNIELLYGNLVSFKNEYVSVVAADDQKNEEILAVFTPREPLAFKNYSVFTRISNSLNVKKIKLILTSDCECLLSTCNILSYGKWRINKIKLYD